MDINKRILKLLNERNWSEYRLSKESGLAESTLYNIFRRNNVPSFVTLESICKGFNITVSQFFAENEMVEMTPELKELFDNWAFLTADEKTAVLNIIKAIKKTEKSIKA